MPRYGEGSAAHGSPGRWLVIAPLLVAAGCTGWPSHAPGTVDNIHGAPVSLGAVGVLPPESPRLDPLRARPDDTEGKAFVTAQAKKAQRETVLARVVDQVAPVAVARALADEGATAVALTRADLLRHVVSGGISIGPPEEGAGVEDRLSYSGLARTYGFTQLLRIVFDGSVREGSGGDSWLFGILDVDYPSGTTWYDVQMTGEVLDAETGEVALRTTRAGRSHSTIFTLVRFAGDEEMIETLAWSVAERVVEDLCEAADASAPPAGAPLPQSILPVSPLPPAPMPSPAADPPRWEPYPTTR